MSARAGFDPLENLGLDPDASERAVEEAYQRRRRETDPAAVAGMDPRIQEAARAARAEVELAYRMLRDPDSVSPEEIRKVTGGGAGGGAASGDAGDDGTKSYWRALVLTAVCPGAGSWYAGGRTRGLVAIGFFVLVLIWMMKGAQASMGAAGMGIVPRMNALKDYLLEARGTFYGVLFLLTADAMVATWAHNDRVSS